MRLFCLVLMVGLVRWAAAAESGDSGTARKSAEEWRLEHRIIDLHQHINSTTQHLSRAVKIMDSVGVGTAVNLSGGTVSHRAPDVTSEFERNKALADRLFPGRFLLYMNLDYTGWNEADFAVRAARQIEQGHRLGAAGLKEYKRLGLFLRDARGNLLKVDDPKLDLMWEKCGELHMPVSIHTADPKAFWLPYNEKNERWEELKDHPNWWFGDTNKFPAWKELLEAILRVVARHPRTTFVCVHFAGNAEETDWVDRALDRYPNLMVDLAARIPELGRHDPEQLRKLFIKHQDRILFATDFQVYDRLTLGSSGKEPPPADADAEVFFAKEWRWLETRDRNWEHMTPIQGNWTISSIGLPELVLRKIYFDNARKLLGRSMPLPVARARHISRDFKPDGTMSQSVWQTAEPVYIEYNSADYGALPRVSTEVRVVWSERYLYLAYDCPYTKLTVFEPPDIQSERLSEKSGGSLWDRDVVEAFIGTDLEKPRRYTEYEVAPTNEKLDLRLELPDRDFVWSSRFETAVRVDKKAKRWYCEMRIPMNSLSEQAPTAGTRWRINFYRGDIANRASMAWSPTMRGTFHTPEKFGVLELAE